MTTTKDETLQEVLEKADPNKLADALRKVGIGYGAPVIKGSATGLTAAARFDLTDPAVAALLTIANIDALEDGEGLPPIGACLALQVLASGTGASVGSYVLGVDSATLLVPPGGANTAVGVARVSDDGSTITFPNTVTGFEIQYMPRTKTAMTSRFAALT